MYNIKLKKPPVGGLFSMDAWVNIKDPKTININISLVISSIILGLIHGVTIGMICAFWLFITFLHETKHCEDFVNGKVTLDDMRNYLIQETYHKIEFPAYYRQFFFLPKFIRIVVAELLVIRSYNKLNKVYKTYNKWDYNIGLQTNNTVKVQTFPIKLFGKFLTIFK